MIFYRSPSAENGRPLSLRAARALTATSLIAYPVGCAVLGSTPAIRDGGLVGQAIGFALVTLTVFAAIPLYTSNFQKIVAEQVDKLDEFELKLRQRAMATAYATFTGLALLGVLYFAIGSDAGLPVPHTYEQANAVFWGVFLYATLLPMFFLVWRKDNAAELASDDNAEDA